ncbi:response regulator with CheY-like receiver, AAA-type ATPase, and DNA-binding domains [Desulfosporosinus youngiae DSM 17734]|uniref:Stage 0 sporulation protein A homolog n=1 Tax=Desulfosporosinus youngiae DSM 17734 TaxID=768710 RepID=H5XV37_9FIRM|nr:response regulator with CheY-like receiver, AAA-type ATPase, and DNA-binding domains [Desulfosporosinus youngiae DSM 17734]
MANILMIEDNTFIGRVIQMVLEEVGHKVEWCKSGTEAFDVLDSKQPDLVMTDLGLPGKSGKEVLEKMRSEQHLVGVPAIIMTGSFPDSKDYPEKNFYQGILEKPFDLEELKTTIKQWVS